MTRRLQQIPQPMRKYIGELNMSKKILSIILLSIALTACGKSTESKPENKVEPQNTPAATESTTKPTPSSTTDVKETALEQAPETTAPPQATETTAPQQNIATENLFAEFINYITPDLTEEQGLMDQKSYDFIVKNYSLFPAKNKAEVTKLVDKSITTKHLNKSLSQYLDKFIQVTGQVIQIEESETDIGFITIVHVLDENGNSLVCVYPGQSGDIFEGDIASVIGVPITSYSFDNISGGFTNATLLALSSLTKEE